MYDIEIKAVYSTYMYGRCFVLVIRQQIDLDGRIDCRPIIYIEHCNSREECWDKAKKFFEKNGVKF